LAELLPKREKLYDYLPMLMKSFGEMKEIFKSVQIETDEMENGIRFVLNNAFIETADEYGIAKYEKVLGILPSDDDDLEVRRMRVKIRWNDYLPYTVATLREKLDTICGVGMYTLSMDLENYQIDVLTQLVSPTILDEVTMLLEKILPAEMVYSVGQLFNTWDLFGAYKWGVLVSKTWDEVKSDEI
jgi:hypothetical protein